MAKIKLSEVPTKSYFIDSDSTYSEQPVKWCVLAHDADGEGITTLMLAIDSPRHVAVQYDAKEPTNPDSNKKNYGNTSYEYSNVLQYLNSDKLADEWFEKQHEYDQSPISPYVGDSGYANKDAFLAHFTEDMKSRMKPVEKMGVTRKVHLPAYNEMSTNNEEGTNYDISFDKGTAYGTYVFPSISGTFRYSTFFRGSHNLSAPVGHIDYNNGRFYKVYINIYNTVRYPYENAYKVFPVIYLDSNTPVEYNSTDGVYYAKWDNAPVLTLNEINDWQSNAFNIVFKVTDADNDAVKATVKIDDDVIYNGNVTLNSNTTVSTSSVFSSLANGKHEITITASDGEKEVVEKVTFRKANGVPNVLSTVSENKVFVDNNTLYNGEPIEWYVVGKDVDGDGIVTLMMKNPVKNHCFDAKEVYNPTTYFAQNGDNSYEYSNLLQWLNAEKGASEWYENQHDYDTAPDYKDEDGFLHNFGSTLLNTLKEVTKWGQSRKVHIPSTTEIIGSAAIGGDTYNSITDLEGTYPKFNQVSNYRTLVTSKYPSGSPLFIVRGGRDFFGGSSYSHPGYTIPRILYNTANSSYSWETDKWNRTYGSAYAVGSSDAYPYYAIPVIYLSGSDVLVKYDSTADKYYLDFSVETQYQDYGKHNKGFTVGVRVNCGTAIGDTVVKAYIDDNATEIATFTISTFNEYADIKLPDDVVKALSNGSHSVTFKTDTIGILGSASAVFTKTEDTLPTILSNEVGSVTETFDTTYQVYDDDGDSIDVVIKLDNSQIDSKTNVEQKTDLTISVGASRFNSLSYGNHTLSIVATDGTNEVTKDIAFKKCSVPSVSIVNPTIGEVVSPFSVQVNYSNADGGVVTFKAYIDGQEIPQ